MLNRTIGLLAVVSSMMYGWDGLGHMMAVAYVAYQTLAPQVRQEVTRLVRLNPSYGAWTANVPADRDLHAFMLAATWPDQIKSDGQHGSNLLPVEREEAGTPHPCPSVA